jgi:hypothetical protein
VPRHPSFLLEIKIKQPYPTSLSPSFCLSLSLLIYLSPSFTLTLSPLFPSLFLSLPLSLYLSLSDWSEGEIVACMRKQKVQACSKRSLFSQSVSIHYYYINLNQFPTKTLVSLNKKCIIEHCREVQTRKCLLIDIFSHKIFSNDLFRATLYRIMLILHKDVMFHLSKLLDYC